MSPFFTSLQHGSEPGFETWKYEGNSLGHKEVYPFFKWLIFAFVLVVIMTTCTLLYLDEVPDYFLKTTIVSFLIMIVGILFLSIYGKQSLTTRTILAPQNLWQVLFNQIPSYIEETDGPLRICLVDIGVKDEKQEDANDICREAEEVIENKVEAVKNEIKERAKKLENNSQGTPLYIIKEGYDLFSQRKDFGYIHGIIAFVGNALALDEISARLHFLADTYPDASIGFVSYGSYPPKKLPPYINLKKIAPENYVNHLIFRYYARSRAWKKLSKVYRRFFLTVSAFFVLLLMGVPAHLIYQNYRTESSKVVIYATKPQNNETSFTRLVNTMFVDPKPNDVKLWQKTTVSGKERHVNRERFAEQGKTSKCHSDTSLISQVIKAGVFLLYNPDSSNPYTVWSCDGVECEGKYYADIGEYVVKVGKKCHIFKWQPDKEGVKGQDDNRIRAMYSYDGNYAVEVIFEKTMKKAVMDAARHSETFLLEIQQFLVAVTLNELISKKQEERSDSISKISDQK